MDACAHICNTYGTCKQSLCFKDSKFKAKTYVYPNYFIYNHLKNIPSAALLFTYKDKLTTIRERFHSMYN